jgi:hypothetical protein
VLYVVAASNALAVTPPPPPDPPLRTAGCGVVVAVAAAGPGAALGTVTTAGRAGTADFAELVLTELIAEMLEMPWIRIVASESRWIYPVGSSAAQPAP